MKRLVCLLALLLLCPVSAQVARPMVGSNSQYTAKEGDSLLTIAKAHGLAIEHIAFANGYPLTAVQIVPGTEMVIPRRRVLPANPPKDGLVLNVPERGIYRFQGGKFAEFIPVGVGKPPTAKTPLGQWHIIEKIVNPTWYPPKWAGDTTPVKPGPNNPLGERWIGLSAPLVGIHGTNDPLNVGGPVTHGCVRCYPEDIKKLFTQVSVGMPVRVEYETAKVGKDPEGRLFLVTFPDIYEKESPSAKSAVLLQKVGRAELLQNRNFAGRVNLTLGVPLELQR